MKTQIIHWTTIVTDLILINLAFLMAYVARYVWQWFRPVLFLEPYRDYLGQQLVLTVLLALTFRYMGVWRRRRGELWLDEVARIVTATAAGVMLAMAVTFFLQPSPFSRLLIFWALLFIVLFLSVARLVRRWSLSVLYRRGVGVDRAIVVGTGENGRSVIRTLLARPDLGFAVVGYLDDDQGDHNAGLGRIPRLGQIDDLAQRLVEYQPVHTVFVALPGEMQPQLLRLLQICRQQEVRALVVPDLLQLSLNRVEFSNMAGVPVLGVRDMEAFGHISRTGLVLKRVLDLAIITVLSLPTLVVMTLLAIAIKLDSPGPVLYTSPRVGRDGRQFKMYKFRSMVADADEQKESLRELNEADGPLFKIKNDPRQTRTGRLIRRLSLDELPQLYNVLRGQMSLVGPRPPLPEEVVHYKPWHHQRLAVVGGMTGLWQVSGRSDLSFDELCLLDIYYIENWTLGLDVRILLQTIPHLMSRKGAY
ncbi:MAG: sugar transferase [Anaerolineae bacterium]|uniref:sugar transferase n=1 Tax=Promineifilum sp. TaxID=2664178 RepID=UPI001D4C4490|nr:sugar transferase [Anaerolineales bacterium]MCB8933842.1 sugar transferase [Promineifilum sp.]MCO5181405.1 sugar transferase [Promineifilum sp.]MCW5846315.1 sugar transferase [Anaerolineae bacterium]